MDDVAGMERPAFTQHLLDCASGKLPVREAGFGALVIVLAPERRGSPLADRLAQSHRVWLVDPVDAERLGEAVAALEAASAGVVAAGADAAVALGLALAGPDTIGAVVLLGPVLFDPGGAASEPALAARLPALTASVLVALGTNDAFSPAEQARLWHRHLPKCHVTFVYDASNNLANERPEAVQALTRDFLDRRERFLVRTTPGVLYP